MGRLLVAIAILVAVAPMGSRAQSAVPTNAIPRADLFPGAINPDISADNIHDNICKKGWSTKSIRPTTSYTNALKRTQLAALEYTRVNTLPRVSTKSGNRTRPDISKCIPRSSNPACYEEDHLISLELGGHPTNPDNLWPEPWFGPWNARKKDVLENTLHRMVCDGTIQLNDAQQAIAADWVGAYRRYVGTR